MTLSRAGTERNYGVRPSPDRAPARVEESAIQRQQYPAIRVGCAVRPQTRSQPRGPGRPCWPQAPEIPGESGPARNSDEIRKRRKAQELRVPDPVAHDFGLGSDFSEASTPDGRAVRRAEEPSETFGCPANWTAERCFLRRCYRNPGRADDGGSGRIGTESHAKPSVALVRPLNRIGCGFLGSCDNDESQPLQQLHFCGRTPKEGSGIPVRTSMITGPACKMSEQRTCTSRWL
jgi:hypothetical protein